MIDHAYPPLAVKPTNAMRDPVLRERHRLAMANPEVRARMSAIRRAAMAPGSPIRDKIGTKLGWLSLKKANDIVERLRFGGAYSEIAREMAVPYTRVSGLAWRHGIRRLGPRIKVNSTRDDIRRFFIPALTGWNESQERVIAVEATQERSSIQLYAALDKLNPRVKSFVLSIIDGATPEEAADEAHFDDAALGTLMPRLREFLRPYLT